MGVQTPTDSLDDSSSSRTYEEILSEDELERLQNEFLPRLKKSCFLDHSGATLYANSQMEGYCRELESTLWSNPHSRNPSSSITSDAIDCIRHRILRHFGTSGDDYTVIFTSGATAALKLVAESFKFNGGDFVYLEESHTSVVGMREVVGTRNRSSLHTSDQVDGDVRARRRRKDSEDDSVKVQCLAKATLEKLMDRQCGESCLPAEKTESRHWARRQAEDALMSLHENQELEPEEKEEEEDEINTLVVYPAQCNFSGYKYPLDWILKVQHGHLDEIKKIEHFYVQPEDVKGGGGLAEYAVEQSGDVDGKSSLKLPLQPSHIKNKQSGSGSSMKDAGADDQCPLSNPRSNSPNAHKGQRKFNWLLLLDAASFVATSRLDLSRYPADFVAISFYKMFGFPTGLGALIVRNKRSHLLEKVYFGGGTVNIQLPWEGFHAKRDRLEERFEDGTISFLSILALRHGFDALARLGRSIDTITTRTFRLARHFYLNLLAMRYPNGQPLAVIYSDTKYDSEKRQGPIVTFNLHRLDGTIIGYSEMEQMAYLHDIHLRYGCFCNVGACRRHLGLQPQEVLSHYQAGHVCGDMKDVMDGKPTGAIRMSVGYMTTQKDVDTVLRLIRTSWLRPFQKTWKGSDSLVEIDGQHKDGRGCGGKELEDYKDDDMQGRNKRKRKVWRIFVYPVKSCAPFEVSKMWAIGSRGLLYDREWLIVNSSGVPLTQKREPRLCQLKPRIDVSNRRLVLSMEGFPDVAVPLEMNQVGHQEGRDGGTLKADLCTSKVCGDVVSGLDCGEEVSRWLSNVFHRSELRLIRMPADQLRKPKRAIDEISLANFSQYLLISMNSLKLLATQIVQKNIQAKGGCGNEDDEADTEKPMNSTNLQSVPKVVEDLIWRFRPNLVIGDQAVDAGGPLSPYEEESWDEVTIGQTWFKSGGPCTRCATICTDQKTGERSAEPFLTLSACRGGSATFGIHLYRRKNMINGQSNGSFSARDSTLKNSQVEPTEAVTSIHVGDPVVVVKTYDANAFNNRDQTEPIKSTQNSSSYPTNGRKLIDSID